MTSSDQATDLMTDLVTHDVIARFVYIKECLLREMKKFFQGDFITQNICRVPVEFVVQQEHSQVSYKMIVHRFLGHCLCQIHFRGRKEVGDHATLGSYSHHPC
jgi:hypothetical protein